MQGTAPPSPPAPVKKATAGFIISLIAGIIDAIAALIIIATASLIGQLGETIPGLEPGIGLGIAEAALTTWGAIGLIMAIVVIIGAILIYMPGKEVVGGILVLIFSIISFPFTLGGLIIGLILGIIGGALGIAKK